MIYGIGRDHHALEHVCNSCNERATSPISTELLSAFRRDYIVTASPLVVKGNKVSTFPFPPITLFRECSVALKVLAR